MNIIIRQRYLDHIISRLNRDMMIILTGQRRVGKSYMLRQLKEWLETNKPDSNIVYINKELQDFSHITNATELHDIVVAQLPEHGENYLLIDEVQDIAGYEDALRSLYAQKRCQIIATGSNAYIFSSELGTRLAGRYIEIPIYSLSYPEFLEFHNLNDSDDSLRIYLKVGGLPGLCHFDIRDEGQIRDYLQGVYNTILVRDIIARENIRNTPFIENLTSFIADNIGKMISVANISKTMRQRGEKGSDEMVSNYISYLRKALLINQVWRYDVHGKKLFEQNYKYYFSDHGLRNLLCGFNLRGSIEKVIENVIYNHLLIQGFKISVGILRVGEIDFVATRDNTVIYIQATYLLASQDTINREFGNLNDIKDNYPKYVVSMDPVSGDLREYPGIHHMNLREFLNTRL